MAGVLKRIFISPASAVICLLLFGVVGLIAWKLFFSVNETKRALRSLNTVYAQARPTEARISGLSYAVFTDTRGTHQEKTNQIELKNAESILLESAENPTAENLHSLGRVFLTKKDFETAIEQFQKALKFAPDDAKIHNDLGAAWLEKGKLEDATKENSRSLEFFAAAFEEFERARQADESFEASYFNEGLCLESMNLPNQAKEAWRAYLNLDSASPWAREAERKLENINLQSNVAAANKDDLISEFLTVFERRDDEKAWRMLSRNREMISGKLIPQQLAVLYSKTKKKEILAALRYAGKIEAEKTADSYWKDVAEYYGSASEAQISELEKAQNLLINGYALCLNANYAGGMAEFIQARQIFQKNGDVLEANLAAYWIGYCRYVLLQLTDSKKELEALAEYCRAKDYRWLLAHALFWAGVNYGSENQKSKAIDYYKEALKASESVSDFYNSQKILTETAEEYRLVNRPVLALDYLQKSLAMSNYPESSPRQKSRTYDMLVRTFYTLESYDAALAYEKETVLLLAEIKDIAFHYASNIQMGQILAAQKKYDEAAKVFADSREIAGTMGNEGQRQERIAFANLHIAHLERERGVCGKALASYDAAVDFYDSGEYKAERYEAHKGRLFCYLTEKNAPRFEKELPTVLEIFENNRSVISDEQTRNIFFDNEQNVYDIAIGYEFDRGNYEKAFDYSEKSRSRSLLDLLENGAKVEKNGSKPEVKIENVFAPLDLREIRARMPERVQIVQYTVLDDKILIWLISKTDFQVAAVQFSNEDLREKVGSYLKLISSGDESRAVERRKFAIELYRILISPFINKIGGDKTIVLIPDKSLSQLAFNSLVSPENGQYFLEERASFFAPSANLFLAFSKNAQKLNGNAGENILSIGNPSFDRQMFPNLQNLSAAEKEASEIAGYYKNPVVLLGKDAVKKNVSANMERAEVIHFAGHYVVDERTPLFSSFILAGQGAETNLANYELIGKSLPRVKLVVLSACQTGVENFYNGEGMIGAARTFLAAGIPLVVASQWEVDSDATAELMIRFHKYRKIEKLSTVDALRRAQLDLINGRDERFKNPYYWSAFVALGGYSEF
ncbi:MAG TPA: CHAT domain-containing protein [Pyrinomonadaceae bacterium]|nr:CHAT domain-containing protein [Pyrinomonadaceae bacterium]